MDALLDAWEDLSRDLFGWILAVLALLVATVVTLGLGVVLWPNLLRAARRASEGSGAPTLPEILDPGEVGETFALVVVWVLAGATLGSVPILGPVAVFTLFLWTLPLRLDAGLSTLDSVRVSLRYLTVEPARALGWGAAFVVILHLGALPCLLLVPVAIPLVACAWWRVWTTHRAEVLGVAGQLGLRA